MSKKRKLNPLYDWAHIPSTTVKTEPGYDRTLADYNRRIASEGAAAATAEQARLKAAQKEATRKFWSRPLAEIGNPQVWRSPEAFDANVGLEDGRFDSQSIDRAFTEFLHQSHSLTGYALDEDGMKRTCWFGMAQSAHYKNLSTPEAWAKCFDRLLECEAFAYGEIVFHEGTKKKPVEQPRDERPTYADLEAVNVGSRSFQKATEIADSLYFDERQPMVRQWAESLRKFGINFTSEDASRCKQWFERNNKSFLNPKHYDECRRWNAAAGFWPGATTPLERFHLEMEAMGTSNMSHEQRRSLVIRERIAIEETLKQFGRL